MKPEFKSAFSPDLAESVFSPTVFPVESTESSNQHQLFQQTVQQLIFYTKLGSSAACLHLRLLPTRLASRHCKQPITSLFA